MEDSKAPLVSVLMASHRVDQYLLAAVQSMLSQTFTDIELVFVANGFDSQGVLDFLVKNITDSRFSVLETPIAQLSHALNLGLSKARGDYIVRMDCDDLSDPHRIDAQLAFLQRNNLDLVGCDLILINEVGDVIGQRAYPKKKAIDRWMPFSNPFAHNSIIIKKSLLLDVRGYNAGFNSEDYDLWLRLRRLNVKWDNMPNALVKYRIHEEASQRRLLGYAEATGLAMREFLLDKSFINFVALGFHVFKSFFRPQRR